MDEEYLPKSPRMKERALLTEKRFKMSETRDLTEDEKQWFAEEYKRIDAKYGLTGNYKK